MSTDNFNDDHDTNLPLAHALGWTSLGIAATEIFGQGFVERELLGIDQQPVLLRSLGAREMGSGVAILAEKSVTPALETALWSRVAGDAMDLALLTAAAPRAKKKLGFTVALLTVAGITALDVWAALRVRRQLHDA